MCRTARDPEEVDGLQVVYVCRHDRTGVLEHLLDLVEEPSEIVT
ncbi:hypothetical protein JCM4914_04390 [Streptomyces platensis subsp. malvinus]